MDLAEAKRVLPTFPRTLHLPHNPNADKGDVIAEASEVSPVFTQTVNVEEKVDGASVGMTMHDDHPLIRNRDHILKKGFYKDTAAKEQFRSTWNWFYQHKGRFEALRDAGPYSVYGEWCLAQHGIEYTRLPEWFVAYDVYDFEKSLFLPPPAARKLLGDIGFTLPRLLHQGVYDRPEDDYAKLTAWANEPAEWSDTKAEGVYIKVYDDKQITHRFKMVRSDFERGKLWDAKKIKKNQLI